MKKAAKKKAVRKMGRQFKRVVQMGADATQFDVEGQRYMVLSLKKVTPALTVLFKLEAGSFVQVNAWNLDLGPEEAWNWHKNNTAMLIAGTMFGPAAFLHTKEFLKKLKKAKA